MLESIEIKNYKIIDSLKVENLTNINVFVGKNNCGKTSLLEAIFLNFKPTDSRLIFRIVSMVIRRINPSNDSLEWFFHKMDIQQSIEIMSLYEGKEMCLKITPKLADNSVFKITENIDDKQDFSSINIQKKILGLDFTARFKGKAEVKCGFAIENKEEQQIIKSETIANYPSFSGLFVPSNNASLNVNLSYMVAELRKFKKEKDLNKYLGIFDEKILGAELIGNEVMLDITDMPKRVSINVMGEGFKKYFLIVSALILNKQQHICIDEIENGLHFESMKKLIEAIVEFCKETNTQLFISTHSYEFLWFLSKIALEKDYKNAAVFNLANTKLKGLQTYRYDMEGVRSMIKNNTEFRD